MANMWDEFVRAINPSASAWRLGTSESFEGTASTPLARISVGAQAGTFYMGMGDNSIYYPYSYFGLGGGVGVGWSTPISGTITSKDFASTGGELGRLFLPPQRWAKVDVTKDTIVGPAVIISPGAALTFGGVALSIIMFGANTGELLQYTSMTPMLYRCNAIGFALGANMTASVGAGVTMYGIHVNKPGAIKRL